MKRYVFTLVLSGLMATLAISQEYWYWKNPLPQGNELHDIWLFSPQVMLAVGDVGTVIKTSNGGLNWTVTHYSGGVSSDLFAVFFIDQTTGWVAGSDGKILKTIDGGTSWSVTTLVNVTNINGLFFLDSQNGWAVGNRVTSNDQKGVILKTTDGGSNWTIDENTNANSLNAIHFYNANVGWAMGSKYVSGFQSSEDIILRTQDGGTTWVPYYSGIAKEIFCASFVDSLHGWAVGNGITSSGVIIHTEDSGVTWAEQPQPKSTSALWGIAFRNQTLGWVVGQEGTLLKTVDGGSTWNEIQTQVSRNLNAIKFSDSQFVVSVGNAGIMIKSEDDGTVWQELSSGLNLWHFYAVDFTDPDTGWIVGPNKTIIKSVDGGTNWTPQASSAPQNLLDIFMVNSHTGWTVGEWGVILKTTDGGTNWVDQPSGTQDFLHSCFFLNDQIGWTCGGPVSGTSSIILYTSDGGNQWTPQNSPADASLRDMHFTDGTHGWAVGANGNIVHTTDGGATWSKVSIGRNEDFYSVFFLNNNLGWIGGNSILKTTDGGATWNEVMTFSTVDQVRQIYFMDASIGWAVLQGSGGALYKTMNGGDNWFRLDIGTNNDLYDISIVNDEVGWIVGTYSTIMKTDAVFVPVELVSFQANWSDDQVTLKWSTASESNNYGFEVQRKFAGSKNYQKAGFVPGQGTTTEMNYYTFKDKPTVGGRYYYRLKQVDFDGKFQFSPVAEVMVPAKFALYQNHPNPFNPKTTISFELPAGTHVVIDIFNELGQKIVTLIDEYRPAGFQQITWNGRDDAARPVGSGIYFYHIKTNGFEATRKLVLLR